MGEAVGFLFTASGIALFLFIFIVLYIMGGGGRVSPFLLAIPILFMFVWGVMAGMSL